MDATDLETLALNKEHDISGVSSLAQHIINGIKASHKRPNEEALHQLLVPKRQKKSSSESQRNSNIGLVPSNIKIKKEPDDFCENDVVSHDRHIVSNSFKIREENYEFVDSLNTSHVMEIVPNNFEIKEENIEFIPSDVIGNYDSDTERDSSIAIPVSLIKREPFELGPENNFGYQPENAVQEHVYPESIKTESLVDG